MVRVVPPGDGGRIGTGVGPECVGATGGARFGTGMDVAGTVEGAGAGVLVVGEGGGAREGAGAPPRGTEIGRRGVGVGTEELAAFTGKTAALVEVVGAGVLSGGGFKGAGIGTKSSIWAKSSSIVALCAKLSSLSLLLLISSLSSLLSLSVIEVK